MVSNIYMNKLQSSHVFVSKIKGNLRCNAYNLLTWNNLSDTVNNENSQKTNKTTKTLKSYEKEETKKEINSLNFTIMCTTSTEIERILMQLCL